MKFAGKPTGTFRNNAHWNDDALAVEFTLDLKDGQTTYSIPCRVSREALDDVAGRTGTLDPAGAVRIYQRFRDRIHDVVDRKLKAGEFGPDNSILVRSAELNSSQ